jgi:mycothiol synthase
MRLFLPTRLSVIGATARLLFATHPRAFVTSAVGSLIEPLFYPALLLILHQMLQAITGPVGSVQLSGTVAVSSIELVALLLIQRLAIIVRDSSSTILRQQAWVVISTRIMHKVPSVPYALFENNAFQARYGLVIREAAQQSITLVDSLLSTIPILLGVLGLAATLFVLAPLMVVAIIAIAIPALLTERRLSHAMYGLQERSAPDQLRMDVLTNMQVDADFQRDIRVYQSNLVPREYTRLAERYLVELKRLTARFLGLRTGAALAQVIGLGLALVAAFVLIGQGQLSVASFAVLIPGVSMLSGMINSFVYQYRSLRESLLYAETLFDFLATSFDPVEPASPLAPVPASPPRLESIRLEGVSYTYPATRKYALLAQPGSSLTFQVHPQAQSQSIEAEILAWGLAQMQRIAQAQGSPRDLWCRCHDGEQERRSALEAAGFKPIFERDLRLFHPLDTPLSPVPLPAGFSLKHGVTPPELDAYQELHQAVFDGVSMGMDYHQSAAYQPKLDLIAVEPGERFGAFCQCEIKQITDGQGERPAGEIGVIGTRPELRRQGLGRALLLTGLSLLQERGATSAFLETSESNVPAQGLFTSVGFRHLSNWQWYAKTAALS